MSVDTGLLMEIRDLLQVIAEPALAKRDERLRNALRVCAGKSQKKIRSISLMDGSRTQAVIAKESNIDKGALSRLVKSMAEASLITSNERPKLVLCVPPSFFENGGNLDG